MPQAEGDSEIRALEALIEALEPLDDAARNRVLEYTLKRLGMRELSTTPTSPAVAPAAGLETELRVREKGATTDIRRLRDEKAPASAIEMAAVVAYYLAEAAPEDERKDAISTADIEKYFKQAAYPLPAAIQATLNNAAAAGYFDRAARGKYRLNPVGFNLVTQNLPHGAGQGPRRASGRKRPVAQGRAKTKRASAAAKKSRTREAPAKKRKR